MESEDITMAHYISIDNGTNYMTAAEAAQTLTDIQYQMIVNIMDDDLREQIHMELAPCTREQFLALYLERANDDLVIG